MLGVSGGRGPQGPPGLDGAVQLVTQTIVTVATLFANFPAGAAYLGKYARVSDLYTDSDEILRCCMSGGAYYWRPQRTDFARSVSTSSGTMNLTPFVTPPQINLTAALTGNMTFNPISTSAWPGCAWDVTMQGLLGVFAATITGLIGPNVPLLTGGTKRIIWNGSGFYTQ